MIFLVKLVRLPKPIPSGGRIAQLQMQIPEFLANGGITRQGLARLEESLKRVFITPLSERLIGFVERIGGGIRSPDE